MQPLPLLADSLPAPDAPAEGSRARVQRRRQQHVQMLGLVLASYGVDTLLMLVLARIGVIEPFVAWAYAGAGLMVCSLFYTLFNSRWSTRQADHYLSNPQLLANAAVNLAFVAWVPQIGGLLLMVLFVVFAFAALRMSVRPVLMASLAVSVAVGLVITFVGERIALPMGSWQERAMCGLWFALVLVRCALLGLYAADLRALLAQRNAQLAKAFEKLELLASRDELTGTLNRRSVMRRLDDELERRARTGQAFGVALLDLDNFKSINDQHGHLVGDEVLRALTATVATEMRGTDLLGRYGGEEFLLLLTTASDPGSATAAVDRMRTAVSRRDWDEIAFGLDVTFSAGVAMCGQGDTSEH